MPGKIREQWITVAANERGKGMREEIQTFIHYMEEEKQASKNTMLSYQRDLLKMADYLEENGITECGKVTKTALNSYLLFQGKEGKHRRSQGPWRPQSHFLAGCIGEE